ncbi:MAG: hypothetical protein P0Y50_06675 [Candidatus Brevundimonas colombiensis]|uniref:Uncharacterized protein n=1 Tax=Candidatus Brevundimonas colombiensis TaxID=3121376 RepID=A0AAJ5X2Y1_9CAUL|nr:hypothetical protein [Brevundimonas sp.]WEK41288.1 MAG: hypothetical protein P0Y50_06675 [Brevundimonas sp.]
MSDEDPIIKPADADDIPGETPVQKALRLKTARLDARPKPPRGGRFQREQAARVAAGKSKPWMTR